MDTGKHGFTHSHFFHSSWTTNENIVV